MPNKRRMKFAISSLVIITIMFTASTMIAIGTLEASNGNSVSSSQGASDTSFAANIGFGVVRSDEEILGVLNRHGAIPRAVFLWTYGLTGTHRTYEAKGADVFLAEMRAKTIETFESGLEGNRFRLQRFAETHTEEEVMSNEELQAEARSFLNLRASFENALSSTKNGEPLIFSVEISGERGQIETLVQEEMVKDFVPGSEVNGEFKAPHTPKPQSYEVEYRDTEIMAMSAQDLYRRIGEILTTTEENGGKQ